MTMNRGQVMLAALFGVGVLGIMLVGLGNVMVRNMEQRIERNRITNSARMLHQFTRAAKDHAQEKRSEWSNGTTRAVTPSDLSQYLPDNFGFAQDKTPFGRSLVAHLTKKNDEVTLTITTEGKLDKRQLKQLGFNSSPMARRVVNRKIAQRFGNLFQGSNTTPAYLNTKTDKARGPGGEFAINRPDPVSSTRSQALVLVNNKKLNDKGLGGGGSVSEQQVEELVDERIEELQEGEKKTKTFNNKLVGRDPCSSRYTGQKRIFDLRDFIGEDDVEKVTKARLRLVTTRYTNTNTNASIRVYPYREYDNNSERYHGKPKPSHVDSYYTKYFGEPEKIIKETPSTGGKSFLYYKFDAKLVSSKISVKFYIENCNLPSRIELLSATYIAQPL